MKGVWWIVMLVAALLCPLVIEKTKTLRYNTVTFNFEAATPLVIEETETLRYNTVTFKFEGATTDTYSTFVKSLRNEVTSKVVFGLPVTAKTVPPSQQYVLVELKFDAEKKITLAVDVTTLYVVGYLDKYQEKNRANLLSGAPNPFSAETVRYFGFTGNYPDLERVAKTGRENIELGVYKLQQAIESVYGKLVEDKIEAKFFLISIQMVSEAARFEYILEKVLEGGIYESYKPDPKAISLETSWDKISKAIQTANPSTGIFTSPIILKDEHGSTWTVTKVDDIKKDMGLLKFLA